MPARAPDTPVEGGVEPGRMDGAEVRAVVEASTLPAVGPDTVEPAVSAQAAAVQVRPVPIPSAHASDPIRPT